MPTGARAYTLAEVLVVIVVLAVVLGPLLAATGALSKLQHRTGERSRKDTWRSMQDQALAAGLDPSRAAGLQSSGNAAIPPASAAVVERQAGAETLGAVRLSALKAPPGSEPGRIGGAGWELAAGGALPPATPSALPELPVVLDPPVVEPANGVHVAASTLFPSSAGGVATFPVSAVSAQGMRVRIVGGADGRTSTGDGRAVVDATAIELAQGFRGSAWAEYPGNGEAGQAAETLPDGRIRWTVTEPGGRARVYEPSDVVVFGIGIDLGAPVLVWGGVEIPSGEVVAVDMPAYLAVRLGSADARVAWPRTVTGLFGSGAGVVLPGIACSLGGVGGASDLAAFFQPAQAALWGDQTRVTAEPLAGGGCVAAGGSWVLSRTRLKMEPPELVSGPEFLSDAYVAGNFEFAVPERPELGRVGRVSARDGALMSSGPVLSLSLSP